MLFIARLTLSSVGHKRSAFLCENGAKRPHKNATQFVGPLKRLVIPIHAYKPFFA